MGKHWKVRRRAKLIAATKPPIRAKALGLGDASISLHERKELVERHEHHRARLREEFRHMARKSPEHLPPGRLESEQSAIDAFSDAIAERIIAKLRGAPVTISLIPKGMKNGKASKPKHRFAPIRVTSFAALVAAFSERETREARSETR